MARVVVLVSNPCTHDSRVLKMARSAALGGHDVHVFATLSRETQPVQELDGVVYHRLLWSPVNILLRSSLLKWLDIFSRRLRKFLLIKTVPFLKYRLFSQVFFHPASALCPDLVHAHDLICLPAGFDIARACKAKLIYDAHELELYRTPPLPFFQKLFVDYTEKKYAAHADAINTVGNLIRDKLMVRFKRSDINVIYNSPILSQSPRNIREDLPIDHNVKIILYVGKVSFGRGIEEFLGVMSDIDNAVFVILGPCDERNRANIEILSNNIGLQDRLYILPPVHPDHVVDYIRGADIGIIPIIPESLSYKYCMPNKFFELMFADIPILSNNLDEISSVISIYGNGLVVNFNHKNMVLAAAMEILKNKSNYAIDDGVYKYIHENYSWDSQSVKLINVYNNIIKNAMDQKNVYKN